MASPRLDELAADLALSWRRMVAAYPSGHIERADEGMTETQWAVLLLLADNEGCRAGELARRANMLVPAMSRMLREFDARDLVVRAGDPNDRRVALLRLSARGRRFVRRRERAQVVVVRELLERLSPANRQEMARCAHSLADILEIASNG